MCAAYLELDLAEGGFELTLEGGKDSRLISEPPVVETLRRGNSGTGEERRALCTLGIVLSTVASPPIPLISGLRKKRQYWESYI